MGADLAAAQARASATDAIIAHLKLQIAKLRREQYGPSGERRDDQRQRLRAQTPVKEAVSRASAARAHCHARALFLPGLRRNAAVEARRGHHRDGGGDPAPVEGHSGRAREVLVQGLREDHTAASTVPCRAAWLGRSRLSRHAAVRQVRPTPATEPPGRALRARGRTAEPVDARRPGWRGHFRTHAPLSPDRGPCSCRRAIAQRRHDSAGPRQGQDRHRQAVGLCPRRSAIRWCRSARRAVPLFARPAR